MTQVKVYRTTRYGLTLDEGNEVELEHHPCEWKDVLTYQSGRSLVVAYNVLDETPEDPMEMGTGNGTLYTRRTVYGRGVITDNDEEFYSALGLDRYGGVDIDNMIRCEPYTDLYGIQRTFTSLRDLAAEKLLPGILADPVQVGEWLESKDLELEEGETLEQAAVTHRDQIGRDLVDSDCVFCDEIEREALNLYQKYWRRLASPLVIPVDYCHSNHGPGTTTVHPDTWDGDPDNLPTGVWVPDDDALDNLMHPLTHKDVVAHVLDEGLIKKAEDYCRPVLQEYEDWCNGNVYGCVVEIFRWTPLDPDDQSVPGLVEHGEWVKVDGDSCWGFYGDYAEEALKTEFFDPAVEKLLEAS